MFNSFFYVYQAGFLRSLLQRPAPRQIEALLQQYLRKPQEVLCIMTSMMQGNGRKAPGTSWDWTLPCLMNIPLIFHCIPADILLVFRCIPLYVCIYIIYIHTYTHCIYIYLHCTTFFVKSPYIGGHSSRCLLDNDAACYSLLAKISSWWLKKLWAASDRLRQRGMKPTILGREWDLLYIIASNCMIYQARIPKLMYNHVQSWYILIAWISGIIWTICWTTFHNPGS